MQAAAKYPSLSLIICTRPALRRLNKQVNTNLQYNDLLILITLLLSPCRLSTTVLAYAITTEHESCKLRAFNNRLVYLLSLSLIIKHKTNLRSFYSLSAKGKALLIRFNSIMAQQPGIYE